MKVAITGADGYVGGLLVRAHRARGDIVHALVRDAAAVASLPGITRFSADLAQAKSLPREFFADVDVLYHCVGEARRETLMHAVNVEGTRAVIAHARGSVPHWVQISSLAVYGNPREGVVDEESPVCPSGAYGTTKYEAECLVADSARSGFSHTIVRPAAAIGPRMRSRSIHALIDAVARGRFFFVGPPGAIGNFIAEENLVAALLLCATQPAARGRVYNLSQNCTLEHIVTAIASEIGGAREPLRVPQTLARLIARVGQLVPGFPLTRARVDVLTSRVEYASERIERELGYRHARSVQDTVRELARSWKPAA